MERKFRVRKRNIGEEGKKWNRATVVANTVRFTPPFTYTAGIMGERYRPNHASNTHFVGADHRSRSIDGAAPTLPQRRSRPGDRRPRCPCGAAAEERSKILTHLWRRAVPPRRCNEISRGGSATAPTCPWVYRTRTRGTTNPASRRGDGPGNRRTSTRPTS